MGEWEREWRRWRGREEEVQGEEGERREREGGRGRAGGRGDWKGVGQGRGGRRHINSFGLN